MISSILRSLPIAVMLANGRWPCSPHKVIPKQSHLHSSRFRLFWMSLGLQNVLHRIWEREREVVWNHRVAVHFLCPSGLQMPGCENGLQTTDVPAERLVADDLSWCWQDCLRRGSTRIPNRSSGPQNLSSMHNLAERLDASTWQRQVIWLWLSRLSQGGPFHGWNMVKEIHWEPMIWKTERHYEVSVLLWFIQVGRAPLYRQDREG